MKKLFLFCLLFFPISLNAQQNKSDNDLLSLFMQNSIDGFKKSFLSMPDSNLLGKTFYANSIYLDYDNNELAANKKYKDKLLRLNVKVNKITDDIFGNVFIVEDLKNAPLANAHFKFSTKDDEKFLSLSKGNKIDLMCYFDEFSSLFLSFNKCLFTEVYAEKIFNKINLSEMFSENYRPKSKFEAAFSFFIIQEKQSILLVCKSDISNCSADRINKSKLYNKAKKTSVGDDPAKYFDSKFGDGWVKSLPKLPDINE